MQSALRLTTLVQPGGRIEVTDSHLSAGDSVDIIVLFSKSANSSPRSVVDILNEAPGHLVFQNAQEVDDHLREERNSWER